jgi:hypothetical protein
MPEENKNLLDEMFHNENPKEDDFNIAFILDRSGSMALIWDSVIKGTNEYIEEQKKEKGNAYFSLVQFDDVYGDPQYWNKPIGEVELLNRERYIPRGMTALYDAIGKTAAKIRELRAEGRIKGKVQFVVQTDGMNNSSTEFTHRQDVADLIKAIRDEGWGDFIFLGANIDTFGEGGKFGFSQAATAGYTSNAKSVQNAALFASVNTKAFRYGTTMDASDIQNMQDSVANGQEEKMRKIYSRIDKAHVRGEKKNPAKK